MKRKFMTLLALSVMASANMKADEGMWMLNNLTPQSMKIMNGLGLQLSDKDLYNPKGTSLKDAVVSFGGFCSGVIVSPEGLVFTNHHCGFANIQALSTPENDMLKNGFVASGKEKEIPAPGLFVDILQYTEDVTARINKTMDKIYKKTSKKQREAYGENWKIQILDEKIDSIFEEIQKEYSKNDPTLKAVVSSYYSGNAYYVSVYKHFTDIRLVFTPPQSLGKFGGETDNWMWPRQTCDFSVFRIYANEKNEPAEYAASNRPYQPKHFAPVSLQGFQMGDYSMTLGFPGSTDRYLSSFGIEERMNSINAARIEVRGVKQDVWEKWMNSDATIRLQYAAKYAQSSNYWKNSIGMNKALKELKVVEQKQDLEKRLSAWIAQDAKRQKEFGNLFQNLEEAYKARKSDFYAYMFLGETFFSGSDIFSIANTANAWINATDEDYKKRLVESLEKKFKDYNENVDKEATSVLLEFYGKTVSSAYLPEFYKTIQNDFKGDYKKFVEDLFQKSVLSDAKVLKDLNADNLKKDIMITYINQVRDLSKSLNKKNEQQAYAIAENEKLLCRAILDMEEDQAHYSDANSTLRLSYGIVADYTNEGIRQNYFTTSQSILDKIAQSDSISDYKVEPSITAMLKAGNFGPYKDKRTGEMQLCFITNNDITGGNSGSPMFNGKGELIGLAFDGNWDAMSSDISFTQSLTRCIGVDIRYVLYIIDQWGKADHLIKEINAK